MNLNVFETINPYFHYLRVSLSYLISHVSCYCYIINWQTEVFTSIRHHTMTYFILCNSAIMRLRHQHVGQYIRLCTTVRTPNNAIRNKILLRIRSVRKTEEKNSRKRYENHKKYTITQETRAARLGNTIA